jgi:hypothetical protein
MRRPVYSGQFKRDLGRAQRRGKDMEKFKGVARRLLAGEALPAQFRVTSIRPPKSGGSSGMGAKISPISWLESSGAADRLA